MELKPGYKQTEVGIIPDDWNPEPLSKISPRQSVGLVINPSTYFDIAGTVPMLVGSNVGENVIDWTAARRITKSSNQILTASRLRAGDLVMVRVGEPGTTAVIPSAHDGCNCASMMVIRAAPSFNSNWLCYAMNSHRGRMQVEGVQYGTAQKQFNISDAVNFKYPVPPLHEQEAIVSALSDVDGLIGALTKLIAKKRAIKKAAMQQLLTGKTRLPGFSGEWVTSTLNVRCECFSGGTPSTSNNAYFGGEIPWITSSDCNLGRIHSVAGRLTKDGFENSAAKWIGKGTLLVALYGATAGVVAVAEIDATINQAVLAILPQSDNVEFLYQMMLYHQSQIISKYTQGGQPNLSGSIIRSVELRFPCADEQYAIATVLSNMDTDLTALETRLAKTKQIKQGMMQQLLTGRVRLVDPQKAEASA